jgi:hypothetical protein
MIELLVISITIVCVIYWIVSLFKSKKTVNNTTLGQPLLIVSRTEGKHEGEVTYGEYYHEHICPKCMRILNHDKARYKSKCCYYCGHSNCSTLFNPEKVIVRDVYVNGYYRETVVKSQNKVKV